MCSDVLVEKTRRAAFDSTELNMFNFGDNVDRNKLSNSNEAATVDFR